MEQEYFHLSRPLLKRLIITAIVGIVLVGIGWVLSQTGGHAEHQAEAHAEHQAEHHAPSFLTHLFSALWFNNLFFTGLSVCGVLFVAIHYAAKAGWSSLVKRVPEALGYFLPWAGVIALLLFVFGHHDLFHWTHASLYQSTLADGSPNPEYDPILVGKSGYLNIPFYVSRLIVIYLVWYVLFRSIRRHSLLEDEEGSFEHRKKMIRLSVAFILFFAVSSSVAGWDWAMSVNPHWFSTLYGWYMFASWWVATLALITLIVTTLKARGLLRQVNENHLHDLGKYVFGFSIFWTYLWFSQLMLIYYANIPEETIYFIERWHSPIYAPYFYLVLILNFFVPFLLLMTRDAKRTPFMLQIVCPLVLVGHWLDFYLMISPDVLKESGALSLTDIGIGLLFLALFRYVALSGLSKAPLVAPEDATLDESIHHHT